MYTCEQLEIPYGGRLRWVGITSAMAVSCLTMGRDLWHARVIEGLPEGTTVKRACMDYSSDCIVLVVEHPSFKLVSGQEKVEQFDVKFQRVYNDQDVARAPVKFREFF